MFDTISSKPLLQLQVLVTVLILGSSSGSKILFFQGLSSYSHRLAVWPLVEELANLGHNVSFLSPFPPKAPNPKVQEFIPDSAEFRAIWANNARLALSSRLDGSYQKNWIPMLDAGLHYCELFVKDEGVRAWLSQQDTFDLILIDALFNECAYGLALRFDCPFIIYDTSTIQMWQAEPFGSVLETSFIPDLQFHFPQGMSFWQRVVNTVRPLYWHFLRCWWYLPEIERLLRDHLNETNLPSLCEFEQRASLVLTNTHFSIEYARSLPPVFVPIGGIHIRGSEDPEVVPKEILAFLEGNADQGFIFISFGSFIQIKNLPVESQRIFYQVLGSFKELRFIWKWDGERPAEMPDNVFTGPWIPQQALLGDSRIKGFITHAGMLSIQEATYFGVPLICFPIFADQDFNSEIVERTGRGIRLEISEFSEAELEGAIRSLLIDQTYKTRMQEASTLFRDRPATPLRTAVWWTEYALRHRETPGLKPLALSQTWYERRLLDVWGLVFGIIILNTITLCYALYKCIQKSRYPKDPILNGVKVKLA